MPSTEKKFATACAAIAPACRRRPAGSTPGFASRAATAATASASATAAHAWARVASVPLRRTAAAASAAAGSCAVGCHVEGSGCATDADCCNGSCYGGICRARRAAAATTIGARRTRTAARCSASTDRSAAEHLFPGGAHASRPARRLRRILVRLRRRRQSAARRRALRCARRRVLRRLLGRLPDGGDGPRDPRSRRRP